jgi:hypothetical protein
MNWHIVWLWFWFLVGATVYVAKRGYYMVKGPNPVANNLGQYLCVAFVPILFRLLVDSALYWLCFTPELLAAGLRYINCTECAGVVSVITQFAPCALLFGMSVDPMVDWGIGTVLNRIPFLAGWWPQMPGPVAQAQGAKP